MNDRDSLNKTNPFMGIHSSIKIKGPMVSLTTIYFDVGSFWPYWSTIGLDFFPQLREKEVYFAVFFSFSVLRVSSFLSMYSFFGRNGAVHIEGNLLTLLF